MFSSLSSVSFRPSSFRRVWLLPFLCLLTVTVGLNGPIVLGATMSGIHEINIATTTVATTLIRQAVASYGVNNVLKTKITPFASSSMLLPATLTGAYDVTISTTGFSSTQLKSTPQYYHFPFVGNAAVPIYNLPASAGNAQLIMPVQALCDVLRGNLTNWSDPRIQAANPDLVMPNLGITVYHLSISASSSDSVTSLCGKSDPLFSADIPRSLLPTWPTSRYYATATGGSSDVLSSMVIETVGSFAIATYQNVVAVKAKIASIKNSAGVVVTPTINSIALTIIEMATGDIPAGQVVHDLAGPKSPNGWPMCTLTYIWLDLINPVTTCATKALLLRFIIWMYSSSIVKQLATNLNVALMPDIFTSEVDLLTKLEDRVTCQGSKLVSTSSDAGFVEGFGGGSALLTSLFTFYRAVNTERLYEFHSTTERLATQRVVANEIDLALINTVQLQQTDTELMIDQGGGAYLPSFIIGAAVTFTLPTAISSKWASWTVASGLPSLYPLSLDLETVAQIFTGQITSWLDSRILATSPQLASWFAAYPTANPLFTVLVCCSSTSDSPIAGLLLMQTLNHTSTSRHSNFSSLFQTPLTFTEQVRLKPTTFTMLELEARMAPKAISIASGSIAGSSIGYKLITSSSHDQTSEFQIVHTVNGVTEILTPEPSNFIPCAQAGWNAGTLQLATFELPPTTGCYPLSSPMSLAVNLAYTGSDCTRGNRSLNLFSWVVNTDALSEAALNAGAFRVADLPAALTATMTVLNSATCDGETLLITLPKVWAQSDVVQGLGFAALIIDLLVLSISGIILVLYRRRTILRSSSVTFLGIILFGLSLLVASIFVWSQPVDSGTCGTFMWFAPLGFSLVFLPFFAKTYRVWAIFSRRQLRVVKISDKKLMTVVGSLLLAEVIFLIIWSQFDPLEPIEYLRNMSGRMHQATHCSVKGNGMTFVVIETIYKGAILIAGTMLAFSTRKVSSAFNESSAIAWSIYNVLFSSVIVGAIVYFVDAFEDTLILLIFFLLAWVAFATWCLLFGAKFYSLFAVSESDAAVASRVESLVTEKSGGFSFISVIHMPAVMIRSYVAALESQLIKARKQLSVVIGTGGGGATMHKYQPEAVRPYLKDGGSSYASAHRLRADGESSFVDELELDRDRSIPGEALPTAPLVRSGTRVSGTLAEGPTPQLPQPPSHANRAQSMRTTSGRTSPAMEQQRRIIANNVQPLHIQVQPAASATVALPDDDLPGPPSAPVTSIPAFISSTNLSSAPRPSSRTTHQVVASTIKE